MCAVLCVQLRDVAAVLWCVPCNDLTLTEPYVSTNGRSADDHMTVSPSQVDSPPTTLTPTPPRASLARAPWLARTGEALDTGWSRSSTLEPCTCNATVAYKTYVHMPRALLYGSVVSDLLWGVSQRGA